MIKLLVSDLEKIVLSENIKITAKEKINIFLSAINDWPKFLSDVQDYVSEVERFINDVATQKNIVTALSSIDITTKAWHAESLSQIVEVFNFYEQDEKLSNIVNDLINELNYKCES